MKNSYLILLCILMVTSAFGQDYPLRPTTPLNAGGQGLMHFNSAKLPDGDILVYGGTKAFPSANSEAWRYDWETETWSAASPLAFAAAQMVSVTLSDGSILCIGGTQDFSGKVQRSQRYDVNAGTWTESIGNFEFFNPIYTGHSAVVLPGDYVILSTSNGDFSVYDPAAGTWSDQASPGPLDAGGSPVFWLASQQQVFWTGAGGQVFMPAGIPTAGILEYLDPAQPLFTSQAVKLPDDRVLTMDLEFSFDNKMTLYDPATKTASFVAEVPFNGGSNTRSAILLLDGRVLTFGFGDITTPGDTKLVQLYDPAADTWVVGTYDEIGPLFAPQLHILPDSSVFAISPQPVNQGGELVNECWILGRDVAGPAFEAVYEPLDLYPNPATGWVSVRNAHLLPINSALILHDAASRLVGRWPKAEEGQRFNMELLPAGMYSYQFRNAEGQLLKTGKLTVHR